MGIWKLAILFMGLKAMGGSLLGDCPPGVAPWVDEAQARLDHDFGPWRLKLEEARSNQRILAANQEKNVKTMQRLAQDGFYDEEDIRLGKLVGIHVGQEVPSALKIPLPERFARSYRAHMLESFPGPQQIKESVLFPGKIVVDEKLYSPLLGQFNLVDFPPQSYRFIPYEDPVPAGMLAADMGNLDRDVLAAMAQLDLYPLGSVLDNAQNNPLGPTTSFAEHDMLGHFWRGFMRDKDYMKAFKQGILRNAATATLPDARVENIVYEGMVRINSDIDWRKIAAMPDQAFQRKITHRELHEHYKSMSPEGLRDVFKAVETDFLRIMRPVSGSLTDVFAEGYLRVYPKIANGCFEDSISTFFGLLCRVRVSFLEPTGFSGRTALGQTLRAVPDMTSHEERARKLSDLFLVVQEAEGLSPAQWAQAGLTHPLPKDSKLYAFICSKRLEFVAPMQDIRSFHGCH